MKHRAAQSVRDGATIACARAPDLGSPHMQAMQGLSAQWLFDLPSFDAHGVFVRLGRCSKFIGLNLCELGAEK